YDFRPKLSGSPHELRSHDGPAEGKADGLAGRRLASARGHHLYDDIFSLLPCDFPGEDSGSILKHGDLWPDGSLPRFLLVCADVRVEPCLSEVGRPDEVDPPLLVVSPIPP